MPKEAKKKWTSEEVLKQIYARFGDRQKYGVLEQVASGTGFAADSWVDVVVVDLWPSNGLIRTAYEIKVDRSDFLREIQNPNKNAWARESHHAFYYVAPSGVINSANEIPEGCGWYEATKGGLRLKLAATIKQDVPMDDMAVASLIRSALKVDRVQSAQLEIGVLKNSKTHRNAMRFEEGVQRFLKLRGKREVYPRSADEVVEELEAATLDAQAKRDRENIQAFLDDFQGRLLGVGDAFAVLATVGLLERDVAMDRILDFYGGSDGVRVANQRVLAEAKGRGERHEYSRQRAQDVVASADALATRARGALGMEGTAT